MNNEIILTDRSRIEVWQKCPRLRWLEYEVAGRGLELEEAGTALAIGSCVHAGIAKALAHPEAPSRASLFEGAIECPDYSSLESTDDQDVVGGLLLTWETVILPTLRGWQTVGVEREEIYHDIVVLMSRSDWIARVGERADVTVNGIRVPPGLYNWNWKTARVCDERRREQILYDAQVFSELLGPEARLGERFKGVVYCILVKENHPLVWAWYSERRDHTASRFNWRCQEAHEQTHTKKGGWCPGGAWHRLGDDYQRVPVRTLPGGQEGALKRVLEEEPGLLQGFVVIIGPMMRPTDEVMERWKWGPLFGEVDVRAKREMVLQATDPMILDRHFPMYTGGGNCIFPLRCPGLPVCWGGVSSATLPPRSLNHEEERRLLREVDNVEG